MVQRDALDPESGQTALARAAEVLGATVSGPAPSGVLEPALRRDEDRIAVAGPFVEGLSDEPFVVADVAVLVAVAVGRVIGPDAVGVGGRVDDSATGRLGRVFRTDGQG